MTPVAVMVSLGEDVAGPGETTTGQGHLRNGLLLQALDQDSLYAVHVYDIDFQCSAEGGVQKLGGVALAEAQELVPLPDLGPRQRIIEESLGEFAHRRSQLGRPTLDAVRHPGGVDGQLGGEVVGVSGTAAPGLADGGLRLGAV